MTNLISCCQYIFNFEFWGHLFSTLKIFSIGLFVSYSICFLLIYLGCISKVCHKIIHGAVLFLQPIPRIVVFPLLLLFFGINDFARVGLIAIGLVFSNYLILDAVVTDLKNSPLVRIVEVYKVSSFKYLYFYYVRGSLSAFLATYKNSVGYGLTLAIIAESSFSNRGLGYLIWRHWERYEMLELYLVILAICSLAIAMNLIPQFFRIIFGLIRSEK